MYKVLCDGAPIYDPRHEDLVLIDPKLTLELNTAGSFTCKIPPGHPQYDKPQEITSRITVYQDDAILFQGRITSVSLDFYNRKTITCEGELAYLNDTIQRPAEYHDMTIRQYLEKIIELHNAQVDESRQFTVGIVTVTNSTDNVYRYTNWETSMQTIKEDLVDDLGGYVRVRYENGKRYIDYITDYGVISKQVIAFGENLLDFTRNVDLTDIATVCIPLGARQSESPIKALEARLTISSINDNKDYVESADAVKRYGRIVKTVTWDDVTTPERLKTHGEKWLEDEQFDAMTLECKAIDLHYVDSSQEALHLGDSVRIVSKPHGLDKYFPVTKLTISLNQLQNNTITFNGQIEQKRTLTARTGSTSEKLKNLIEVTPNKNEMVSEAIAEATALITAHTHGYVTTSDDSSEFLVSDTPDYRNATNIWRWNLNGLGHSSTGYSGTYTTALTMDGWIVGSRVAAGSIGASQLSIDYKNTVTEEITEKSDAAKSAATSYTDTQLDTYKSEVSKAIQASEDRATKVANSATDLANAAQKTADGKITTYYQTDAPTADMSTGDLWIDTDDGNKLYRYGGTEWTAIQDKAISDAMTAAGTAQATADGKVVTYAQASAPASTGLTLGDLWIDTDDNNHMYRWDGTKWAEVRDGYIEEAKNAAESYTDTKLTNYYTKSEIETSISNTKDEILLSAKKTSTEYTDSKTAALQTAVDNAAKVANSATDLAKAAQTTANSKITTYYQVGAPTSGMATGDLWIDQGADNLLRRYDGTNWVSVADKNISAAMAAAGDAQATADGKIETFCQTDAPASGMVTGDLWIDTDDGNKLYRYDGSAWVVVQDTSIAAAADLAKAAQKTADGKITTYYQTDAPTSGMTSGDLWIDTDDGNKLYRYDGTAWTTVQDTAIAAAMTAAGTAQATADGKVVTYAQADAPASTGLTIGDLWIDTDDNNHMYRWDGTKWAEVRDGYIEEAKNAAESYTDTKLKEYSTSAEIKVMTDSISAEVAKKTDSATIISTINQSAETVSINASKIALEGLVTANKNFQIDTDGNMTAVNGKFSGIITGATMQVADSSGTSQTAITSDGKIKSVDSNKTFWLDMQNGAFELGPIESIGTNNQDLLISRMLNVEYGVEIWRQNENGEPYIDFHCEADSPSATSKYDYAARLSCQKAGYFQMLGADKGDGNGHAHARLEVGGLELYTSKSSASSTTAGIPYIDFHLEDTAADYSMRIAAETTDSCVIRSEGGYAAIINTKAATISSASSKRVKRNIENITDADAEKLLDLRPVSFEYVYAPGETYHGLIAEEVQKVLPELVVIPKDYNPDDDTDMLHIPRLCYTDFIPYLIRLCQIQQKEIDALKGETA